MHSTVFTDALNTVDFVSDDEQHPIFQTCATEKHAVVFQLVREPGFFNIYLSFI